MGQVGGHPATERTFTAPKPTFAVTESTPFPGGVTPEDVPDLEREGPEGNDQGQRKKSVEKDKKETVYPVPTYPYLNFIIYHTYFIPMNYS